MSFPLFTAPAWRSLFREWELFVGAVASLALGLAAATLGTAILHSLLLFPFDGIHEPAKLVGLHRVTDTEPDVLRRLSYPDFETYAGLPAFSAAEAYAGFDFTVQSEAGALRLSGLVVTPGYFELLGARPAVGRFFSGSPGEEDGDSRVVVLSEGASRSLYGSADDGVVGRTLRINGQSATVVGVARAGFSGTDRSLRPDVWIPVTTFRQVMSGPFAQLAGQFDRRQEWLSVVGRLAPGVSGESLRSALEGTASALAMEFPEWNTGERVEAIPSVETAYGIARREETKSYGGLIVGALFVTLLVACLNVGTLLAARALARRRELSVRTALGADRQSLSLLLVGDVIAVFLPAFLLGIGLAQMILPLFESLVLPADVPIELALSLPVLVTTALLALVAVVVVWLIALPRDVFTRPASILQERATLSGRTGLARRQVLVGLQAAVAVASLVGAFLLVSSVDNLRSIELGFETRQILLASVDLSTLQYDPVEVEAFYGDVRGRLLQLPTVESVGVAGGLPLVDRSTVEVEMGLGAGDEETAAKYVVVDDGFFDVLGLRPFAGRFFESGDERRSEGVAVVVASLARELWGETDVVGRRVLIQPEQLQFEVLGVAPDIVYGESRMGTAPVVYLHRGQSDLSFIGSALAPILSLMIGTTGSADPVISDLRAIVADLEPRVPVVGVTTLEELLERDRTLERQAAWLLGLLGGVSLLLALIGLYAIVTHTVVRRRREIGVRRALGASGGSIFRLILFEVGRSALFGVLAGCALALAGTRLIQQLLFRVPALSASAYWVVAIVVTLIAGLLISVGARRALTIDPSTALDQG